MSEVLTSNRLEDLFYTDFEQNKKAIIEKDTAFVTTKREEAIEEFRQLGLPDTKNELYRFTDIKRLFESGGRWVNNINQPVLYQPIEEFFKCNITDLDTYDLVLIDGHYPRTIPVLSSVNHGAKTGSLADALELYPEIIDKYYSKLAGGSQDALTALNTAFATDGIFVHIPSDQLLEKPVQIITLVDKNKDLLLNPLIQYRNLAIVEKNSEAKLVFCDHTIANDKSISNSITEIFVGENAKVEIYRVQNQHNNAAMISGFYIHQEKNSSVTVVTLTLNGGFVRNNINVLLEGENASTELYGLYLVDRKQHVDNYTFIDHKSPRCNSEEYYRGILDDEARGVFRGKIMVRKDAQKTNSFQKNNNLLMTNEAVMNTMPQLEIYADDVKCSHGATVGYLDAESLFYLRSRGIGYKEARLLLMNAFAADIIKKIKIDSLRDRLSSLVYKRLRGELSPCATCVLKCNE